MKNIAVVFGGRSIEREISVITGVLTLNCLDKTLYKPIPVYVHTDGSWYTGDLLFDVDGFKELPLNKLSKVSFIMGDNKLYKIKNRRKVTICEISAVINCMHGERGEDGSLAGLVNMCNIAFASPDIFASSACISKVYTKYLLKGLNVKTLPYFVASSLVDYKDLEDKLTYPVIVKPERGGSSIGITKVKEKSQLKFAISTALRYGERAVIEPFLDAIEINCACYLSENGAVVSECEQPMRRGEILDFSDKYREGKRVFPAEIDRVISDKIKRITQKIYLALNMTGAVRIDFFLLDGKVFVNEINTVPGSLANYLFGEKLADFTAMLTECICVAQREWAKKSTYKCAFNSGILYGVGSKGSKRLKK